MSPILFTNFLADFAEVLEGLDIKFIIYANDIFIYCENGSLDICRCKLQEVLRLIVM